MLFCPSYLAWKNVSVLPQSGNNARDVTSESFCVGSKYVESAGGGPVDDSSAVWGASSCRVGRRDGSYTRQ